MKRKRKPVTGDDVKVLLRVYRLTMAQLAALCGVSLSTVYRWAHFRGTPVRGLTGIPRLVLEYLRPNTKKAHCGHAVMGNLMGNLIKEGLDTHGTLGGIKVMLAATGPVGWWSGLVRHAR